VGTFAGLEIVNVDWVQWLLFSAIAIGSLLVFRGPLLARMSHGRMAQADVDSMVGEVATALEALPAGATGKAELRGTTWSTKNVGAAAFHKGQRGKVTKVDGLTLWITAE
jgi:membrane protein implicated in regulation of membrane protease activity